jgi:hypothetical protein
MSDIHHIDEYTVIAAVWTAFLDADPELSRSQVHTMLDLADAVKRGEPSA